MPRFFAGYKLHSFLYLSQFLGTMTCIRRAVLHIRPVRNAWRRSLSSCTCPVLNAHEPLGGSWLNGTGTGRNTVFGQIVHAYSCYQSENISFPCLLKRVIDLIVLNHYICYDNNAVRITCQDVFLDFSQTNKYDKLIKEQKRRERRSYTKLWSMIQRK